MCIETSGKSKTSSRVYVHRNEWKVEDIKPCLCASKRVESRRHQAVFMCIETSEKSKISSRVYRIETSGKSKTSSRVYVHRNEWKVEDIKPCLCVSKRVENRRHQTVFIASKRVESRRHQAVFMCIEVESRRHQTVFVHRNEWKVEDIKPCLSHRNEWKVEDIKPCLCASKPVESRKHQAVFMCIETSGKSKTSNRVYVHRNEWKVEDIKPCLCAS